MQSAKRISALKGPAVLLAAFFLTLLSAAQTPPVNVAIDASKTGAPISKYLYGQFLEHGGDIVNTGVWAELLADRKFFYPVAASAPTPPPLMGNAAGNPRFRRPITRWWAPIGGDGVVSMDTKNPYTGDHTPLVKLDAKTPHGIGESGVVVRNGKTYTALSWPARLGLWSRLR
jgi:alpha-N-arabinofuranosidase